MIRNNLFPRSCAATFLVPMLDCQGEKWWLIPLKNQQSISKFPCEPHYESEAEYKSFSYWNACQFAFMQDKTINIHDELVIYREILRWESFQKEDWSECWLCYWEHTWDTTEPCRGSISYFLAVNQKKKLILSQENGKSLILSHSRLIIADKSPTKLLEPSQMFY